MSDMRIVTCVLIWDIKHGSGKPMTIEDLELVLEKARAKICMSNNLTIAAIQFVMDDPLTLDFFLKCRSETYPFNWAIKKETDLSEEIAEYDYVVAIECEHTIEKAREAGVPRMLVELGPYRKGSFLKCVNNTMLY